MLARDWLCGRRWEANEAALSLPEAWSGVCIDYMEDCGFSHEVVAGPAQLISLVT